MLEGLKLINNPREYEFIIITRFDLIFVRGFRSLILDVKKFNILFLCKLRPNNKIPEKRLTEIEKKYYDKKMDDGVYVMPGSLIPGFIEFLDKHINTKTHLWYGYLVERFIKKKQINIVVPDRHHVKYNPIYKIQHHINRTILITGCCTPFGYFLAKKYIRDGSNLVYGSDQGCGDGSRFIRERYDDLVAQKNFVFLDNNPIDSITEIKPGIVIHLEELKHCITNIKVAIINMVKIKNECESAGIDCFVYSLPLYKVCDDLLLWEKKSNNVIDPIAYIKNIGRALKVFTDSEHNIRILDVRLPLLYGPGDDQGFVSRFLLGALENKVIYKLYSGTPLIPYLEIDDATRMVYEEVEATLTRDIGLNIMRFSSNDDSVSCLLNKVDAYLDTPVKIQMTKKYKHVNTDVYMAEGGTDHRSTVTLKQGIPKTLKWLKQTIKKETELK